MIPEKFPVIESGRLLLTPVLPSDIAQIFKLFSDDRIMAFYDMDAFENTSQALDWIEKHRRRYLEGNGIRWAIRYEMGAALIGTCGFTKLNLPQYSGEIGYDVLPEFWGQGIATEAVDSIIEWGFSECFGVPLRRIVASVMMENDISSGLLRKLGFQEEGIARAGGYWKCDFHDLRIFSLLRSDRYLK